MGSTHRRRQWQPAALAKKPQPQAILSCVLLLPLRYLGHGRFVMSLKDPIAKKIPGSFFVNLSFRTSKHLKIVDRFLNIFQGETRNVIKCVLKTAGMIQN